MDPVASSLPSKEKAQQLTNLQQMAYKNAQLSTNYGLLQYITLKKTQNQTKAKLTVGNTLLLTVS